MQTYQATLSGNSHLSCVFDDAVISFPLAERPTLADIADMLSEPSLRRHGAPLAIKIAWPIRSEPASQVKVAEV